MFSRKKILLDKTSTPKRHRLGTGRILRPNLQIFAAENAVKSPSSRCSSPLDKNDDPPLPCNQIEYLCDSGNTSSTSSEIPCSPGVFDDSIMRNPANWESLIVKNTSKTVDQCKETVSLELEDISEEMFQSKLEQSCNQRLDTLTSECEQHFVKNIEQSFDLINQSIIKEPDKINQISLLETKDSFLLDIKESMFVEENQCKPSGNVFIKPKTGNYCNMNNKDTFYGLPLEAKELFKTYRDIEKFYDWQEECLSLAAVLERRNLVYALPTSGGKTLVAEVLMMREVLTQRRNVLFVLPFVAIVQEKMWSLSPFALKLDFLVEEYTGGKGHIPPKRRRNKNSMYIATIEKALAAVRSLLELGRLHEIGLVVVDELHLLGEPGRGASLEMLLTTLMFACKNIQIIGMSATIGNLPEVAAFLHAEVYQRDFRPVELAEYVKRGRWLYRLVWGDTLEVVPHTEMDYEYNELEAAWDPEGVGPLVWGAQGPVLVFCPTKRNAENVAALLCKLQREVSPLSAERTSLCSLLRDEGAPLALCACAGRGVAYHHAGVGSGERALIEHAYRSGVISVICCTMTLAAGVNLPAARVVIRAPRVGRALLSLTNYRQMAGRAGRKGHCQKGESIIMCTPSDWPHLHAVLKGGLVGVRSALAPCVGALVLSAAGLKMADTRAKLRRLLESSFLAVTGNDGSPINCKQVTDDAIRDLIENRVLAVSGSDADAQQWSVGDDSVLTVSALGRAAIKGCMELAVAEQLARDLTAAGRALVLVSDLHLLYLMTPEANVTLDYRLYYELYCSLDEPSRLTAEAIGITERSAIRMVTGKQITNVSERVLRRFYVALMLHDLWRQVPVADVADKYSIPRGTIQSLLTSSAAFAAGSARFCEELGQWRWAALLGELAPRLHTCAAPQLTQLMALPAVRKARALQLSRAGYKRIEDIAKASADELVSKIEHLSRSTANHLISAARMALIEKVENLRAEAEDVMEELNK